MPAGNILAMPSTRSTIPPPEQALTKVPGAPVAHRRGQEAQCRKTAGAFGSATRMQ